MSARVVVVGAGLAGLAVAQRLTEAGLRVVVIDQATPREPELASVPEASPELRSLASSLGIADAVCPRPVSSVERLSREGARSLELSVCKGIGPRQALRARRGRRLMRWYSSFLDAARPELGARFDDRSVRDWSDLYLGKPADRDVFAPLLAAAFGLDSGQTSRLTLLPLLDPFAAPRIATTGGVNALRSALRKRLDDVRDQRAIQIGRASVTLESGDEIPADALVLATPADEVCALVPDLTPAEQLFFGAPAYVPVLQLVLETSRGLTGSDVAWVRTGDGPLAAISRLRENADRVEDSDRVENADRVEDADGRRWLLAATPHWSGRVQRQDDAQISERMLAHAVALRPEFAGAVERMRLDRRKLPRFDVGRHRAAERVRQEQAKARKERRLFYCNECLTAPHPEAALTTARRTSAEVLDLVSPG